MQSNHRYWLIAVVASSFALSAKSAPAQHLFPTIMPGQRSVQVRDPSQLAKYRIYDSPPPPTVSTTEELEPCPISLDDVIRFSLNRTDVVRILTGATATSSGQTIYDAAITNTTIDQNNARFDPVLSSESAFTHLENPQAVFDPVDPTQTLLNGYITDGFANSTNLTKLNALGGTAGIGWNVNDRRFRPQFSPLNPQADTNTVLSYTQPLLRGAGIQANMAPIVISRINTELSFFVLKDSVQEMVRGVIEGYWTLVAARTDVWSKEQQIEQLEETVRYIKTQMKLGIVNRADLSQVQVTLANTRANLVTSRANMIQREDALRNLIGMPPSDGKQLIPHTPPTDERFHPDWSKLLEIAAERRPDLVEMKLIIEADEQQIILARNSALPQLDGVALYRWNGLEGTTPAGPPIRTGAGEHTDWTLGVNFSVPLGLRQARATLRQRELIIARDRINLHQGLHNAAHILATNIRSLDQYYELYLAYREVREAAKTNLDYQLAKYRTGNGILINVLQAVTDWGNAISNEANSLANYNTTLATLERQSGTILETHGVTFYEERYGSIGPLGRFFVDSCYAAETRPGENGERYPMSEKPAEEKFDLKRPKDLRDKPPAIDYDKIPLPTLEESVDDVPPEPDTKDDDDAPIPAPSTDRRRSAIRVVSNTEESSPEESASVRRSNDRRREIESLKPKSIRARIFGWGSR
ncbi:TolC family protein [Schlesneria sp. DSM 10557]|uniref:TolC family protein n=1 Tax=Schlesneria sp. DSM 10557 TaxID=3044399 RepID=UPI0035A16956